MRQALLLALLIAAPVPFAAKAADPPERRLERSVRMNPGEIVLARIWSTA